MTEIVDRITNYTTEFFKCFLCDRVFADGDEPWHLFEKRLLENGQADCPLSSILSSALGKELEQDTVHSKLLCDECNFVLLEYEGIEKRFYQFRLKILSDYNNTAKENGFDPIWFEIGDAEECAQLQPQSIKNESILNVEEVKIKNEDDDGITDHIPIPDNQDIPSFIVEEEQDVHEQYHDGVVQEFSTVAVLNNDVVQEEEEDSSVYAERNIQVMAEEITYEQIIEQNSDISYDNSVDAGESAMGYNSSNDDKLPIIPDDIPKPTKQKRSSRAVKREQQQEATDAITYEFTENMYICALCPEKPEYEPMLFPNHMKNVHNYKFYVCDICYKGFNKRNEISDHMDDEHGRETEEGEFQCETCLRVFLNHRLFRIHKRLHYSSTKQHECPECHKKYSSKNLLDEHMNMHTGKRPYKCLSCSKDFASKYTLQAHLKIHTKRPRPYSCDECDKSFLNHQNLVQHKKLHSGLKSFVCEICQKAFGTQHNLDVHKIVHSGNKPFICRTCGKGFARRAEIRDHERTHTGERPFKCDICSMAFAQRSNLMTHKKVTHLNDKKHKCTLCDRSFKRRRLLEYHTQSAHTGERPHKCEVCSATFVYPEHFKKHMRIHSGVKPYACEVCGKLFNSRDNRNAHRFIHSEKKPYECLECGMGFMRKPLLLSHMKHTKHVNDTIIVNQPQIRHKGMIEVDKKLTTEDIELDTQNISECTVSGVAYDEVVTSDTILVEDGDGQYIKDEDGEVKYLQFTEMDKDGQATFTWVDIGEDKEDDN